jgi:hypothetical protein
MRRPSTWLLIVIILVGAFILREPRLQAIDDSLRGWFMTHAESTLPPTPVTQVEIGREDIEHLTTPEQSKPLPPGQAARRSLSPLEYALFLQAVLEFRPNVVAIESLLIWRDRDKVQEQVFIDQAMRVPKLLVAVELGAKGERELSIEDLPDLPNVFGPRGGLPEFTGVRRQPDEDIRLISTPGLINSPDEKGNAFRVPMIFDCRGQIVPAFALEAIMLWLRLTPAEVNVELGRQITLPNGWKIPIHRDGTTTINPTARQSVRRLSLNELLLAAQEHEKNQPSARNLENLKDQIILLRIADDPLQPPNPFSAAIATIQGNFYIRSAPPALEWIIIFAAALLASFLWRISKANLFSFAIIFSAGYALVALGLLGQQRVWIPMFLPMALLWFLVVLRVFSSEAKHEIAATG